MLEHRFSSTRLFAISLVTAGALSAQFMAVAPASASTPTCGGKAANIVGTAGPDVIHGTSGPDVIVGLGGLDTIFGLAGDDIICGNGPTTPYGDYGGPHGDVIFGGPGDDILIGGPGRDELHGGPGADTLLGGPGEDFLYPGAGDDTVDGGGVVGDFVVYDLAPNGVSIDLAAGLATGWGRDTLVSVESAIGSRYADTILGDSGPNDLHGDPWPVNGVHIGAGDVLDGRGGNDSLWGWWGNDVLHGGPGDDVIQGGDGTDIEYGGPGNDHLFGEHLDGGGGHDLCRDFTAETNCESLNRSVVQPGRP